MSDQDMPQRADETPVGSLAANAAALEGNHVPGLREEGTSPASGAKGRVSGKRFVPGCAVFLLLLIGGLMTAWWMNKDPHGPILAAAPVDDERIALVRRGYEERGHVHVGVWDESGPRWSTALFGVPDDPAPTVYGGVLYVKTTNARGYRETHAYDADDGTLRWRGPPLEQDPRVERAPWTGQGLFVSDERVDELHFSDPLKVVRLNRETGEGDASPTQPGGAVAAWLEGDSLVVSGPHLPHPSVRGPAVPTAPPPGVIPRVPTTVPTVERDGDAIHVGDVVRVVSGLEGLSIGERHLAAWTPEGAVVIDGDGRAVAQMGTIEVR